MISAAGRCLALLLAGTINLMAVDSFTLTSPAFERGRPIPAKYAYANDNISPPLAVQGIPTRATSLVLIMDDPDSPTGLRTHWLVWNLPVDTTVISSDKLPAAAVQGKNASDDAHYDGPAPPLGPHRYFFHLYALDTLLTLAAGATRSELEKAMSGHVVGKAEIYGTYEIP